VKRASASPLDAAVVSFLTLALAVQLLHLAVVAWRLSVDYKVEQRQAAYR